MNEQLQKLYEQSFVIDSYVNVGPDGATLGIKFDPEKFAELIVKECANQCDLLLDHKISSEWARGTHDCSKAIRKHFGVEE